MLARAEPAMLAILCDHCADFHLSGAGECHASFMEDRGSYARFTKDVDGCTWLAGVQHIGHILAVSIILEAQLLHTHKCAQGKNKCDCMLLHH